MTADERIAELLARAGSPVMVVRNTQESDEERHKGARAAIERTADEQFHGNVVDYIGHLVDTIDRLEVALYNTLNERDQLLADLNRMTNKHVSCDYCLHKNKSAAKCRGCSRENDNWTWRGVPDKEE